jgi:hypothetical protein
MELALVSNYMIDVPFLVSLCPELPHARRLLLVHGQGQPETEATAREAFRGCACEVRRRIAPSVALLICSADQVGPGKWAGKGWEYVGMTDWICTSQAEMVQTYCS